MGRPCQVLVSLCVCLQVFFPSILAALRKYDWVLTETNLTKLCGTREVVTVNVMFPGPLIRVNEGDILQIRVQNSGKYNATIHWHGIYQLRTGWADGPEYITQCPIQPGKSFTYRFAVEDQTGTLWWHAHSSWLRATVYGAFIIDPKKNEEYPYSYPGHDEILLIGEWWSANPMEIIEEAIRTGGGPQSSDYLTINGEPGDFAPCSSNTTTRITVKQGEAILIRMINSAMNTVMFVGIANHSMTVVAADALYTKPFKTDYLVLDPGQTVDVLVTANQPCGVYYIAAHAYASVNDIPFDESTTTALLEYSSCSLENATPITPDLPDFKDTDKAESFHSSLRSLNSESYPSIVPRNVDEDLLFTVSLGILPCGNNQTCLGPFGQRLATSVNNISFSLPSISILQAYFYNISGVYTTDFPDSPLEKYNFTDRNMPMSRWYTTRATKVKALRYNTTVQVILQGTGIQGGESHPFHLHGHDFYVVGRGSGNYDPSNDPTNFNLIDPQKRNTVNIPVTGWVAIRFVANNPGAWLMHCHLDFHVRIGMAMVFITDDYGHPQSKVEHPPADLPACRSSLLYFNTTKL